jgi:hypothetical protein
MGAERLDDQLRWAHTDTHTDPNTDRDGDSNSDANGHGDGYPNTDSHSHEYPNADCDSHGHPNTDRDGDSLICESDDACGAWPSVTAPRDILGADSSSGSIEITVDEPDPGIAWPIGPITIRAKL